MSSHTYAVLIGINFYNDSQHLPPLKSAEKNCKDLYQVLTDPDISKINKENIFLVTGEKANTYNIWDALDNAVRLKPTLEDTVLVYICGYGFIAGEQQRKAYLGSRDVNIGNLIKNNPLEGLLIEGLYKAILLASPAKNVLLIVDIFHRGTFVTASTKGGKLEIARVVTKEKLLEKNFFADNHGRVAIVSSSPENSNVINQELDNTVFTHYLLEGLRGKAVDGNTGEVTIDSLFSYLRQQAPANSIPEFYGEDYGRIVITKPNVTKKQHSKPKISLGVSKLFTPNTNEVLAKLIAFQNPLEPYQKFIDKLLQVLYQNIFFSPQDSANRFMEAIRNAAEAEFVTVLRQENQIWISNAHSDLMSEDTTKSAYIENIICKSLPSILKRWNLDNDYSSFFHTYDEDKINKAIALIPLKSKSGYDLMVICGLPPNSYLLQEVTGRILNVIYSTTEELSIVKPLIIESAIFDDLKRTYGFISPEIYKRRFELFRERLHQMVVNFEPVLHLDPDFLYIDSWEALARNPENGTTPVDLFAAAELWGDSFMIELDSYFIRSAITSYREAYQPKIISQNIAFGRRKEDIRELSVNVYPHSLVSHSYFDTVREVIQAKFIQPEKLILEISEKLPLPSFSTVAMENKRDSSIEFFRKHLQRYVRELRVGFAVDDFGVGHSSVSRLTGLNPTHVKIDREILHQQFSEIVFRFVQEIASQKHLRSPKVVFEGVDINSPVSLGELYKFGIRYVQGHIIGKATPDLNRLPEEKIDYLLKLINQG
jgi:EAL domain-containing protein (putative c-di-GMP-specific phosphodiesterase class I)